MMRGSALANERGGSKIIGFILLAAIAGAIYVGFRVIPVYMAYLDFKDTMLAVVQSSQMHGDDQTRAHLMQKAHELDLPLSEENIFISHDPQFTIEAHWNVTLDFPGGYMYVFDFHPIADSSGVRDASSHG